MSRDTASLCCPDVEDWCCALSKTTTAVETAPAHTGILAPLNGFLRAGSQRRDFRVQRLDCPGKCLSKLQHSHRWGMRVQGPSPASSVTDTWTVSVVTSGGWWPSEGGEGEVSPDFITIFNGKGHINVDSALHHICGFRIHLLFSPVALCSCVCGLEVSMSTDLSP